MKSILRRAFVVEMAVAVLTSSCTRGIRVQPIAPPVTAAQGQPKPLAGVLFHLPKTVVMLTVDAEAATETPGEFCDFKPIFFPDLSEEVKCPAQDGSKFWFQKSAEERKLYIADKNKKTEVKGFSTATRGTPDLAFVVPISESRWADSTDTIDVEESGVISGAEGSRTDRKLDTALAIANAVAGIAGKFIVGGGSKQKLPNGPCKDEHQKTYERKLACRLASNDDSALRIERNLARLASADLKKYLYALAWPAIDAPVSAELIPLLRASRAVESIETLLDYSQGDMDGAVKQKREDALKLLAQFFLGTKKVSTWNPSFEIVPVGTASTTPAPADIQSKNQTFTLFHAGKGCFRLAAVAADTAKLIKGVIPENLRCKMEDPTEIITAKLAVMPGQQPSVVFASNFTHPPADRQSYPFIIPTLTQALLEKQKEALPIPAVDILLAQWGVQSFLPMGSSAKGKTVKVTYYGATGAIKSVKLGSEAAVGPGLITSLVSPANTLIDAKLKADKAAEDAAAKAGDELAKLTRTRQLLEERDKIAKLCVSLGIVCPAME